MNTYYSVASVGINGSYSVPSPFQENCYVNEVRTWRWAFAQAAAAATASELYRPRYRRLSAKLVSTFADRGVSRSQRCGSLRPYSRFPRPEPLFFLSSSSSIVLTRLSGPRSRPTTSQIIC
jgi:hypothetical protein